MTLWLYPFFWTLQKDLLVGIRSLQLSTIGIFFRFDEIISATENGILIYKSQNILITRPPGDIWQDHKNPKGSTN